MHDAYKITDNGHPEMFLMPVSTTNVIIIIHIGIHMYVTTYSVAIGTYYYYIS